MNSLQEVVESIQDVLERPDMSMDLPMVRAAVLRGLNQVHGLGWFDRDLQVLSEQVGMADTSKVFALPDTYRKLQSIYMLDVDGELLTDCFKQGRLHRRPSMNYGLQTPNYYVTLGDELRVVWGNFTRQGSIEVVFYSYPTVTYDDVAQEWTTDSWLIPTYAPLVVYNAAKTLAGNVESSSFTQLARIAEEAEFSLLNEAAFSGTDQDMRS